VQTFFFQTLYNVMVPGPAMWIKSEKQFYQSFLFDISFYILIGVVLLNIVFGIILDTFGALRDETQTREDHLNNYCFICNLSNGVLDHAATKINAELEHSAGPGGEGKSSMSAGKLMSGGALTSGSGRSASAAHLSEVSGAFAKDKVVYDHQKPHQGFLQHTAKEHDVWSYIYFIFHINSKDPTTYTGPEQTIRDMLANEDIGWFPIERATLLEKAEIDVLTEKEDEEGVTMTTLEELLIDLKHDVNQRAAPVARAGA